MFALIFTDMNGSIGIGKYAGPYRIASEFRKQGKHVKVVDYMMSFSLDELKAIIITNRTKETEWIGFSSTFLVGRNHNAFVFRTGTAAASEKSSSIGLTINEANDLVDFIISLGMQVFIGGSKLKYDIENVKWIVGPAEGYFTNSFNFTNSTIDWHSDDHIFNGEHLPIEIARGCIFKCSFCSYPLNGKKLWEFCKSPETLRFEMQRNYEEFNTIGYMFADDTYNDSIDKIKTLHDMYKTLSFDLEFSTYARLDLILSKPDTLKYLMDSGLQSVFFGVETLNHLSGKSIGKGMHPDKIKNGLMWIMDEYPHLIISIGMIAGLPHETKETLIAGKKWLEQSGVNFSFQALRLNKKSKMGSDYEKYGYIFDGNKWTNDHMTFDEALDFSSKIKSHHLGGFTFYNRLRNLGYSITEVRKLTMDDRDEINHRQQVIIDQYKGKVLNV